MAERLEQLSVKDMESMSPDERRAEFQRRIVTDPTELSPELRDRIRATAERLDREHRTAGCRAVFAVDIG